MKRWSKGIWLILLAALLLCSCAQNPQEDTPPPEDPPTPLELYTAGRSVVDSAQHLILEYQIKETRTVRGNDYIKEISGKASYSDWKQETMTAVVEENLRYGAYENRYSEIYCGGAAYVQAGGNNFMVTMQPEAFIASQIPGVLINPHLYVNIVAEEKDSKTVIRFSNQVYVEDWLAQGRDITLLTGSATATLDSTGQLTQCSYTAEYVWEGVSYRFSASTHISVPKSLDLSGKHPDHIEGYTVLSDLRIPKLLMQAVGDVYSAKTISYHAAENIYSEALPLSMTQTHQLLVKGTGENLFAQIQYQTTIADYRGEESVTTQEDTYQDGVYTTCINGAEPEYLTTVPPETMRQACEDAALSALMAMKYLSGGTVTDQGDTLRVDLLGNDSFQEDLMVGITDFLQVDLDAQAEAMETVVASGYLVVDKYSGLPASMGLALQRTHKLTEVTYQLNYSLDQTLSFVETE